ncbi:MAG TPA: TylF/MycF/NovP-related O-methyltransferase [Gaiellaceae bacterium]|nr:TylF/MycF/NovP-related O-methyltransferase [Gaiellaceae bacterium]
MTAAAAFLPDASVHGRDHDGPERLYLDLVKQCLTRSLFDDACEVYTPRKRWTKALYPHAKQLLAARGLELVSRRSSGPRRRAEGRDHPAAAETMIGLRRLDNLEHCVVDILRRDVPGDLIETGVWRGGATIFMRAVLRAYRDTTRRVWAADSFAGLPRPDPGVYPQDEGDAFWTWPHLAVPLEEVEANFSRYGLLDDQVRFLPGWFRDTLPNAPIDRLSLLRLDGDMYESTIVALRALYPKLAVGGYVIVDDYAGVRACKTAVDDFRSEHGIDEPLHQVDWTCVFWRRET